MGKAKPLKILNLIPDVAFEISVLTEALGGEN